ncbi:MAG TPA: hypothetical protein PL033_11690 [Candidatus Brocadiia bacterium]|nr:hypothetical protein [Candidatus Brocadiia bacterium]
MIDSYDMEGEWWVPDAKDRRVSGKLEFRPGTDMRLILSGSIVDDGLAPHKVDVICGVSSSGELITLFQNAEYKQHMPFSITKSGYHAVERWHAIPKYIVKGEHFSGEQLKQIKVLRINFEDLKSWYGQGALDIQNEKTVFRIDTAPREPIIVDCGKISIWLISTGTTTVRGDTWTIHFESDVCFELHVHNGCNLDDYMPAIIHLQNLLVFMMGHAMPISKVSLPDEMHFTEIEIDFLARFEKRNDPARYGKADVFTTYTPLVGLQDVKDGFPHCLQKWFSDCFQYHLIHNLVIHSMTQKRPIPRESGFLFLVFALEGYHAKRYGGTYIPPDDYVRIADALKNAIPNDVQSDLRESLRSRIRYGNDYSLRKRLRYMMETFEEQTQMVIANDPQALVNDVVDIRNDMVHCPNDGGTSYSDLPKILAISNSLTRLAVALFLRDAGIPEDVLRCRLKTLHWDLV